MSSPCPPTGNRQLPRDETRTRIVLVLIAVVGAGFLGVTFQTDASHPLFYVATLCLALCWFTGALIDRRIPLAPAPPVRSWAATHLGLPVLVGAGCVAVFTVGALIVRYIPALERNVVTVLERATAGSIGMVILLATVTAVAEELFFRGALFDAFRQWHPVAVSTLLYGLVTAASASVMLVFAALCLGVITALMRVWTGGLLAPIIVHMIWTSSMIVVLPHLLPVST
ncbi:membrane protease YdiL (CAAX protease family) [Rhodococcus sp. 27YEA15]|uniref:CPBP family intramembrane glutamic endopeptidase n=1 Tax=Rhodococcus sp. 27YEA15 TaxID=3156259 RepID=UPI003C79AF88